MKKFLWTVAIVSASAVGWIILGKGRRTSIDLLAGKLQDDWTDNHTEV